MKTLNMKSVAFLSIEIIWYFAAHPVQAVLCVCICVILHNMDLDNNNNVHYTSASVWCLGWGDTRPPPPVYQSLQ